MERRARETRERAKMERRAGRRAVGKRAEREQERGCDDDGSSAQRPGPGAWAAGLRLCGQIEYASYQARPQRPNSKAATASWRPACCCVRAWMLERSHHTPTSALREPQCTCPSPRHQAAIPTPPQSLAASCRATVQPYTRSPMTLHLQLCYLPTECLPASPFARP